MTSVLIVGAGPTGLMAAVCLARFGVDIRIIDRAATPPDDRSRAAVVQPRTLEAFDALGIADEAMQAGHMVDSLNLYKPSGRFGRLTFARPGWLDSPYHGLLALPQDQTERILTELLTRLGVRIERGVSLASLEQRDESLRVQLQHADGQNETLDVPWIYGADGAHSSVRELSGLAFPGVTYRDEGLIGDVDAEWNLPHDRVSLCPRADGFMLVFPLPGERHFRVIMIVPNETPGEDRHLGLDEFRARLDLMTPRGLGPAKVLDVHWLTRYRLHRRGVKTYRRGRAFVGGDAAHIHSPVGAQGMNTGVQDSLNLAWKLALVVRGDTPEWLLDTYDEERRHIGELLLDGTDRAFALVAGHGFASRMLRRIAPTIGARILATPFIARRLVRFVSQLEIKYRRSRLSVNAPGAATLGRGAPEAGDRAPDVAMRSSEGAVQRLFDFLREPRHTLLVFEGRATSAQIEACVAAVRGADERRVGVRRISLAMDSEGRAHARYGAERGAMFLVRPDGYIGFRGSIADIIALEGDLRRRFA